MWDNPVLIQREAVDKSLNFPVYPSVKKKKGKMTSPRDVRIFE